MKSAIITGITGQDGAYLGEFLINKGYKVFGTYRRNSSVNFWRLKELNVLNNPNLELVEYDLTDLGSTIRLIEKAKASEVYNLAAQSFVGVSFDQPIATGQITGLGVTNLLESIRIVNPKIRFYQASTSEMFGLVQEIPQKESTPFYPRSPYGVAKLYAHWMTINYRESYGIFATSGILFNHESPLRGKEFVTRKITDSIAKIELGKLEELELGNLNSKRDWGYAKEYIEGMYKMLQVDNPDTYVLATNRTATVRDFLTLSYQCLGKSLVWKGRDIYETGIDSKTGKVIVRINPKYFRPTEVDILVGNSSKAELKLQWKAETSLEDLTRMMVDKDLERNLKGETF